MLFDLAGHIALITGSTRGLGRAMAEGLAAAGATVILNGTDRERVEAAVQALLNRGHDARGAAFDVSDEVAIREAFNEFDRQGLAIDILINNAGIQLRKPMLELEISEWNRVMETNLTSAFMVGREAAKRMVPRGRGKIINLGSISSELAREAISPYTVAKGGLLMLTRAMTAEWAPHGIQANAIGPGYMLTDMSRTQASKPEFDAWVKKRTPSSRWGTPDELVGTAIYLASSASDYVNGQIIYVDGGLTAVI